MSDAFVGLRQHTTAPRTYSADNSASFLTLYKTHGLLKQRSKPKPTAVVAFELLKILKAGNPGHKLGPVISSTLVECLSLTAASIIVNEFRIR
jgi:hypothetical protein